MEHRLNHSPPSPQIDHRLKSSTTTTVSNRAPPQPFTTTHHHCFNHSPPPPQIEHHHHRLKSSNLQPGTPLPSCRAAARTLSVGQRLDAGQRIYP
ncbi:hypothetical protein Droror1_Dr00010422 [Drosera rotundifolia]